MHLSLAVVAILLTLASALKEPPTKLQIGIKKKVECTRKTVKGDKLAMHYTGKLFETGEKFDSSLDRGTPLDFTLGAGMPFI